MESEIVQLPLTERAWIWVQNNLRQALLGAAGLILLGIIVAYYFYHRNQKEIQAGEALSNATATQMPGPQGANASLAEAYLKVAAEHPNSKAGAAALLLAAGDLFTEGKVQQAKVQFQKLAREHSGSPLLGQALLGIASCLEAEGKSTEAIAGYKDLVDHHPSDSVVPQAKLALARLYTAQNKPELARDYLEQVAQMALGPDNQPRHVYGSMGSEAGMMLEELKAKFPNLVKPPPAPASSAPFKLEAAPAAAATGAAPANVPAVGTNLPGPAKP